MSGLKSHLFVMGSILVSLCSHAWAAALPFGQTQTGTISSAAQSNSYTFSANANDVVDLTMAATSGNLSPKIRLYKSDGTLLNSVNPGGCYGSTIEMNTVQLPATGTYTVLVGDCGDTSTGNYTIYAQLTNNPAGAAALPFGQTQTAVIGLAAQRNSYAFSGNAKDLIDFTAATTGNLSPKIRLYKPDGTLLTSANPGGCYGSTIEINTVQLPATGSYTMLVGDCGDTSTGSYTIYAQRTNNPAGAAALPFGSGQPQTGLIGMAAQSSSYTLSANANDVIDFTMAATSGNLSPKIRLYNPDGTLLTSANPGGCYGSTIEMNTVQLPATGSYTALVGDCGDTSTGAYTIYAQRTNNPAGAAALPFGQTQTAMIGSVAQSNSYAFSASANDVIDFTMAATSGTLSPKVRLYNPDGTLLKSANPGGCYGSTIEMNTVQLPATGSYTVLVGDCGDTGTGAYGLYAQRTNNPAGAAVLTFGGQTLTGTIGSAAQRNSYTFSGSANDVLDFTMTSTKGALSPKLRVYNPAGTQIGSANPGGCYGSTIELNNVKLPATGTYTVLVGDCGDTNTGNYNLSSQCFGVCPATTPTQSPQTITFGALNNQVLGTAPFALSAAASSGLAVTFASNTPSVCTVSGITVTLVALGTCSITASQPGNSTYAPAAPVTQSFAVIAGSATIPIAIFGTGYVAGGPGLAAVGAVDGNFNLISCPAGACVSNGNGGYRAFVTLTGQYPFPFWVADTSSGQWIGPASGGNEVTIDAPGLYVYREKFDLSGFNLATVALNGFFAIDDTWNYMQLNGVTVGPTSASMSSLTPFSLTSGFVPGINTIDFFVTNGPTGGAQNPTGLMVELSGSGTPNGGTAPTNCNYSLAPASQVLPAAAGTGTIGVLTSAGCPWTASSGASFLSIASGASGTGPGVVQFSATANSTAAARAGTLTIAGQTATINQAGTAPLLLLSPTSIAVQWRQQSPLPVSIPLSVFTAASSLSFTATASSTGNWLTVSPASGSAPATIIVTVNPSSLQPGTYQGTVTVTAPTANPSSQSFTVSLTVVAAGPPALSLTTTSLNYSFSQGTQQVRQQRILVGNSGGGTLTYNASASTSSGGNWLSVTQDGAGATLLTPDPLTVSVDPSSLGVGTYTGLITITAAGTTQNIPVTATVSAVQQTILLSQTGLTFTAVGNGGIVPPQTLGILNGGNGFMDWSVSSSTVTGGNTWLSVTPNSGTTDASSSTVPLVTVSVNPANLAPGQYSGQIEVASGAANNTPQFVSVILNVLPAGSNPGPVVLPTGLIFTEAVGGTPAGSQKITLSNLTGSQLTFATGKLTIDGANWFSVTPATGTATPAQAMALTVSVSSAGLSPAMRQGVLTLLFQDGSVRTVNISYLLAGGGVSSQSAGYSHTLAAGASCTPTRLLPLVTSFGFQFTVPAGWPNTLATQVVDDCGNPHVSGTVTATFSNGDPPLPLISLKNGNWMGTWQVRNANASVIVITVNADNPSLNIAGSISVSGGIQSSATAPVMAAGGVLSAASYSPSAPLAPGTMVSIFGSNLANGTSSASALPLSTQLSGTLVTIGGEAAPLLYASQGQVNAIIPYGLPVNTNTQVIVQQGNAYTSPEPITLSAASPAIFTKSQNGTGQGIIIRPDGQYAQPGTPAQAGDEVVIYAAGLGETTPQATAGQAATTSPLLRVAAAVSLTIGGQNARVDFAGLAPTFAELYQINAAVPAGVHGDTLPVVLTVAGQPSPTVTIAVQ
jgi:uncharacterized protein (TIGR03437 family)